MRLGVFAIAVVMAAIVASQVEAREKIDASCSSALLRLWNQGPNRWQPLGRSASGEHLFVRGIGAKPHERTAQPASGAQDALHLLSGKPSETEHYVWVISKFDRLEKDPTYDRRLGTYSSPLSIAGRTDKLEDAGKLGEVPVASIPAGELDIKAVESFGLILPAQRGEPQVRWAEDYVALTRSLMEQRILYWVPGSRGQAFYQELQKALQRHRQSKPDHYAAPHLQEVFDRYED